MDIVALVKYLPALLRLGAPAKNKRFGFKPEQPAICGAGFAIEAFVLAGALTIVDIEQADFAVPV